MDNYPIFGGGGGGGGTFYDFESVFSDSGGGMLDGILSGGFGGMLGEIESILGGSDGYDVACGIVIMNFAPDTNQNCDIGGTVFDSIFEEIGNEINMPEEIKGVITGKQRPQDILSQVLKEELAKIGLPTVLGGDSSIGAQGIPEPEKALEDIFKSSQERTYGDVATLDGPLPANDASEGQRNLNLFTPNVNTTLVQDVQALELLTTAVTNKGLSKKGQEVTEARHTAAQVSSKASGTIGNESMEMAAKQLEAASMMGDTTRKQTSTQDTIKEGLTGMNMLQAQATQFAAQANTQHALATQVSSMDLQVSQELRDGVFANGISLKTLNNQASEDAQKKLSQASSLRVESERSLRMLGAMR
ncbi:hypothetical protein S7335_1314 [Synechococcus sp. PCC 7335]|uniref:hypothetical protein n=1 Tax=Synechococcus sp. (strain ATCC 29403 / PCC 7335) TaxID=91464 RepID=UPI00017EE851|nr:hypothetical protein [Synechococcus sp. PCC 7335]EDX82610.1 hypothetical protein S7335_1314 [Synechococcus sp. PCC 7335]